MVPKRPRSHGLSGHVASRPQVTCPAEGYPLLTVAVVSLPAIASQSDAAAGLQSFPVLRCTIAGMYCVVWTYAVPPSLDEAAIRRQFAAVADRYIGIPGL